MLLNYNLFWKADPNSGPAQPLEGALGLRSRTSCDHTIGRSGAAVVDPQTVEAAKNPMKGPAVAQ